MSLFLKDTIEKSVGMVGAYSSEEIRRHINRYLLSNLITDLQPFSFRSAVTYEVIDKDADAFSAITKVRSVADVKQKISNLEHPLSFYTNRRVYSHCSNAYNTAGISTYFGNNLYSTEREREYFTGGQQYLLVNGSVSKQNPLTFTRDQLRMMSNYWNKVVIKRGDITVDTIVLHAGEYSLRELGNSFQAIINYRQRTITVQGIDDNLYGFYNVSIYTFFSYTASFLRNQFIYSISSSNRSNVIQDDSNELVDCYTYPLLIFDIKNDGLDKYLNRIINIVTLGTAKNLSVLNQNYKQQQQIVQMYNIELQSYLDGEIEKDVLQFKNVIPSYDPLNYTPAYNYYGSSFSTGGFN